MVTMEEMLIDMQKLLQNVKSLDKFISTYELYKKNLSKDVKI